jgi:hypothetical protein
VPAKIDALPAPTPAASPAPTPAVVAVAVSESRPPPPRISLTNGPPEAHPRVDVLFERPDALAVLDVALPLAESIPEQPRRRNVLGAVVDVVAALVLVGVGGFCGELLARQSSVEVLRNAASAARFPPADLLMWLVPIVVLLLVYALLISRGKGVGSLIRRRRAA